MTDLPRNPKLLQILGGILLLAAVGMVVWNFSGVSTGQTATTTVSAATTPVAGSGAAPDAAFEDFEGRLVRLDDWRGELLVVNFWASWCPPCVAEMRDTFQPFHEEFGDRVTVLGVDLQDERPAARDVVEDTGVTYALASDPDGSLFTAFGGFGMPTTVMIDSDGTVVHQHTGALVLSQLEELAIENLGLSALGRVR